MSQRGGRKLLKNHSHFSYCNIIGSGVLNKVNSLCVLLYVRLNFIRTIILKAVSNNRFKSNGDQDG